MKNKNKQENPSSVTTKQTEEEDKTKTNSNLSIYICLLVIGIIVLLSLAIEVSSKNELTKTNSKIGVLQTENNTINNRLGQFNVADKESIATKIGNIKGDIDANTNAINTLNENLVTVDQKVNDLTGKVIKLEEVKPITLASPQNTTKMDKTKANTAVKQKTTVTKPQKSKTVVKNKNPTKSYHQTKSGYGEALKIAKEAKAIAEVANTKATNAESTATKANEKATSAVTIATNADKKSNTAIEMAGKVNVDVGKLVSDQCLSLSVNDDSTICDK